MGCPCMFKVDRTQYKRFLSSIQSTKKIDEYRKKAYHQKLSMKQAAFGNSNKRFVPHFSRKNPNKSNKFRFNLDARAKSRGIALND